MTGFIKKLFDSEGQEITLHVSGEWAERYFKLRKIFLYLWSYVDTAIFWLTRYFPFSLIWRNKLGHFNNKRELFILRTINKVSHRMGHPVKTIEVVLTEDFVVYPCQILTKKKVSWRKQFEEKLTKAVGEENIFFREGRFLPHSIDVMVPRNKTI